MTESFRPRDDEAAVINPRLLALVELARAQRLPPLRSQLKVIQAGVAQQRRGRTRVVLATAVVMAAAVALVWTLRERPVQLVERGPAEQAERSLDDRSGGTIAEPADRDGDARVHDGVPSQPVAPTIVEPAVPAPGPEVTAEHEAEPPTVPSVEPEAPPAAAATRKPTPASDLARQAEQAMAEQRRGDAIKALSTLVRRYPTSGAARAALLDLGRLLRADGRRDEARCAYRQLVARWPSDPMRAEIDRALASLGDGPECRGMKPQ